MIITIFIIPVAYSPAMTTTPATIHRLPRTTTPMTAADGTAEVIVAVEVMAAVGVIPAAVGVILAAVGEIDRMVLLSRLLLRDAVQCAAFLDEVEAVDGDDLTA